MLLKSVKLFDVFWRMISLFISWGTTEASRSDALEKSASLLYIHNMMKGFIVYYDTTTLYTHNIKSTMEKRKLKKPCVYIQIYQSLSLAIEETR